MSIEDVFEAFKGADIVRPRAFYSSRSFNGQGTSLNYYIHGVDSEGYDAGLKLDFFDRVRFTNYKKPHPVKKYDPYFDKFIRHWSCSYEEFQNDFTPTSLQMISVMAQHWSIPVKRFANTLLFAGELLWDAEESGWLGSPQWDGGEFIGTLPSPKRR